MPRFIYNTMVIEFTHKQCIDMELYLNLTDKNKEFIQLGDKLYNAIKIENQQITIHEYYWLQENIIKI